MSCIIGIDVSKHILDVCFLKPSINQQHTIQVANQTQGIGQLLVWIHQQTTEPIHAAMEATGRYWYDVAHALFQAGHQVSVVNPARIKAFGRTLLLRNKTDAQDAWLIAHFCQLHRPDPWTPPETGQQRLKELFRRRDALLKMRQQERNRLKSGHTDGWVQANLQQHIAFLSDQITTIDQEIHQHLKHHPRLWHLAKLIQTLPGIGKQTAVALLAEVRDITAFDQAGQLVAYVGINPQRHESGTSIHKRTRISKRGNARLRAALFMPAVVAKSRYAYFAPLVKRLEAAGHRPMSIVIAVMRKLLHLVYGILKSGQPFDPHYLEKRPAIA